MACELEDDEGDERRVVNVREQRLKAREKMVLRERQRALEQGMILEGFTTSDTVRIKVCGTSNSVVI